MKSIIRWIAVPSLLLGTSLYSFSEKVTLNDAQLLATEFMRSRTGNQSATLSLIPVYIEGSEAKPLYYVFNAADNNGFVIISGESTTTPVLGYSFEGAYPVKTLPDGMKWMLEGISREIKVAPSVQSSLSSPELKNKARKAGQKSTTAKRLSTPEWSQEGPFNSFIPGRPLVGCVGTAMATIMRFHQWPANGAGSFGGVDFNAAYDWANMRMDNYRSGYSAEEGDAVATLMYHASKSIDTQYAMSGSSAYEVRVPGALSTFFGYDAGVSYKKRSEVASQEAWDQLVKDEIDAGRPVLYCGQDVTAGHAFVCDGYEGEFLHFNWGWGGSANGYFRSTMLNPTVSRTHQYNNLNTIIYNIKPASGSISKWSAIHITADGNQTGIGSNLKNLASGEQFKVRVGNLKNLTYNDFSGKIAVALCDSNGKMKTLLSQPASFSMQSMGYLFNGYQDFNNCQLPSGVSVADSDRIRIMTLANGETEWLPVAGELITINELEPTPSASSSFRVVLPTGVAGVEIEGEPSVIRGWNYSFKVTPSNPAEDVVTVKANGVTLAASGYTYTIDNVKEDQNISVVVQKASEVKAKRSIWVGTPGTLSSIIPDSETGTIKELTLFGSIDARDFTFMKNSMNLSRLDISGTTIAAYGSDQANAVPREAFKGKWSLNEVVLPSSVNRLNNGCFRQCGITTVSIPAGVSKYEYNVFCGSNRLRDIYVGRQNAEFINWCVLSGVNTSALTLHVPNEAAINNYRNAENWQTIANIIADRPQASDNVLFAVMENNEVKFETEASSGTMEKGTAVTFKASHIADNDNKLGVYANSTLLTPDADGNYKTIVNSNTIIHFELTAPLAVDPNKSAWSLNGQNGSVGLLTDAVNVIPGVEFSIRVNAVNIPSGYDQAYWGMALTDASGNIKEFISPVNVWTSGPASNHKFNVNCMVRESSVREGNRICLVTSFNKKNWNVVKAAAENIVDAIPALNNMTEVYNINVPEVKGAVISGITSTAVRGRDMILKIVPNSAACRVDLSVNGTPLYKGQASVNYPFVAMQDMDFDIKVYDPKEVGSVTYHVKSGELYKAVTPTNIMQHVIVTGETYASDISAAFTQLFAQKTVKKIDLSGLKIVADPTNGTPANWIPVEMFYKSSGIGQTVPAVEEVILPSSVVRISECAFKNCANIKEITLPDSLYTTRTAIGTYTSGSIRYGYGLGYQAFAGCTSLRTIRIPGKPRELNGQLTVAHHNPGGVATPGFLQYEDYNLGHDDAKKITVVVPQEYLSLYKTRNADKDNGNAWQGHGYNILAEYPVYGVNFDPLRVSVEEDTDISNMASFLFDNVGVESIKAEKKIRITDPSIPCKVFDNGVEITPDADGYIDVEFFNPAKNADKAGNHQIDVVYAHDLRFNSTSSSLFSISEAIVTNDKNHSFHTMELDENSNPVLKNVAENSGVRFKVEFNDDNAGLEPRIMSGSEELTPDEEGFYAINITNSARSIDIYAVPCDGATLNAEELAAINPEELAGISSIALEGELSDEVFAATMESLRNLESLDLSKFEGELPESAFSGMTTLTTMVLPEVSELAPNMFDGCTSLQSIDIPATVTSIGAETFKDCKSLEQITFTGISSIGEGAFSGCDNLTTITLLNASSDSKSEARRKARKTSASLSSDAFEGMNPNCIVVLDQDVEMPQAKANYLRTSTGMIEETLPDGTITEREGRTYSACDDIAFFQGHPLAIPFAFNLEEGVNISMEAQTEEWNAMVVPFEVKRITDAADNEIEITVADNDTDYIEGNLIFTLDRDAESFRSVAGIEANTPVIFRTETTGKMLFSATAIEVPATPDEIRIEGKDFSLHATYAAKTLPASEVYSLDFDAAAFSPTGDEDEEVKVKPFEVYASSPVKASEIITGLPSTEKPGELPDIATGIEDAQMTAGEFSVIVENGSVVVYTPEARTETIYDGSGKMIRVVNLAEGRNTIDLPKGAIYMIGNRKVVF